LDRPRPRAISNDWRAGRSKRTASASYSARPVDSLAWPGENLTVRPVASRELGMSRNTAKDYRRLDFVPAAAAQEGARRTRGLAEGTPAAPSRQCRCDPPPDLSGCHVSAWGSPLHNCGLPPHPAILKLSSWSVPRRTTQGCTEGGIAGSAPTTPPKE